jgi:hypothetical protein
VECRGHPRPCSRKVVVVALARELVAPVAARAGELATPATAPASSVTAHQSRHGAMDRKERVKKIEKIKSEWPSGACSD